MKKRIIASLLSLIVANSLVITAMATETGTTTVASVNENELTTGTQQRAAENVSTVDDDIQEDVAAQIPTEFEEVYIDSVDDFLEFANNCKIDVWSANKKVILQKDISLVGKDFEPISTFAGIFEGSGHTISEMNLSAGMSYMGLFSRVQSTGVIRNLNVTGSVIPSGDQIAVGGIAGENSGSIVDCSFKGVVAGNDYTGGICGTNNLEGTIFGCKSEGYIRGKHATGGIVGHNIGLIRRCKNEASVNTTNEDTQLTLDNIGILGNLSNVSKVIGILTGKSEDSETANTSSTISDTGGIAGLSIGVITRSVNNGDVGYEHVGYNVGGIVGRQSGYVLSCINNAKVLGRKDAGGIVGQAEPYIQIDLSADVAYQLEQAIDDLHGKVTVTLRDAKTQSGIISNRVALIQQYTAGAINDLRYLSAGTVDFANGVSSATTEAFSRVEYVIDEAAKKDGVVDQVTYAANDMRASTKDLREAVDDLNLDNYLNDAEKAQYQEAKDTLASVASQYTTLYEKSYFAFYNEYVAERYDNLVIAAYPGCRDLVYELEDGSNADTSKMQRAEDDLKASEKQGTTLDGTWKHSTDGKLFPDSANEDDVKLNERAAKNASENADEYARKNYTSPSGATGKDAFASDMANAAAVIANITYSHMSEMSEYTRDDAISALDDLDSAAEHLNQAGKDVKAIVGNLSARDDIAFPQLSSEYRQRTTSLSDNLQGMNDNFGLLNSESNNATGVLIDDLQAMADQFNKIMQLYSDALDGALEMDYTQAFEDVSLADAAITTDATIDSCINYGIVEADINSAGIAGTMAIEYEYDLESDITGIKNSKLNTSYITKCVLRDDRNYGNVVGEKNYVGGVCGLQEMGTIIYSGNYANVSSSSGEYVGGIAGSSLSYVVSSYSKGIMSGSKYVGGICGDGMHIRDSFSLVSIDDVDNWCGAIAGHVDSNGVVRNNFFVSDKLAGIDRISYAQKAEPVTYDEALTSGLFNNMNTSLEQQGAEETEKVVAVSTAANTQDIPTDFNALTVTFMVEDDDLEDGKQQVAIEKRKYGESFDQTTYPEIDNKPGFYVHWDTNSVENITTDKVITATYKRYLTTLSEDISNDGVYQSELLVDGAFKEDDHLTVTRSDVLTYEQVEEMGIERVADLEQIESFETINLLIPNDGNKVHQIRFRPNSRFYDVSEDYTLYQVSKDSKVALAPTGEVGEYKTFEIEGNDVTLMLDFEGINKTVLKYGVIIVLALVVSLVILVLIIIYTKRHGRKLPKFLRSVKRKVSKRIENKEQIFFNEDENKVKDEASPKSIEAKEDNETDSEDIKTIDINKPKKPKNSDKSDDKPSEEERNSGANHKKKKRNKKKH